MMIVQGANVQQHPGEEVNSNEHEQTNSKRSRWKQRCPEVGPRHHCHHNHYHRHLYLILIIHFILFFIKIPSSPFSTPHHTHHLHPLQHSQSCHHLVQHHHHHDYFTRHQHHDHHLHPLLVITLFNIIILITSVEPDFSPPIDHPAFHSFLDQGRDHPYC